MTSSTRPVPEHIHSILVVRQHDQLGDMMVAIPLLRALRKKYPKAVIRVVARPKNAQPLFNHPDLDGVCIFDKERIWKSVGALMEFLRCIRSTAPDVVILPFTNSFSTTSSLIALASGAKIRVGVRTRAGERNGFSFLLTHPVDLDWSGDIHRHQAIRNLETAGPLEIGIDPPEMTIGFSEQELAEGKLEADRIRSDPGETLIGIHTGGKTENRWPPDRFADLIRRLLNDRSNKIFLTCGPQDDDIVRAVVQNIPADIPVVFHQPLRQVAAIIRYSDLFISNDTGMMHVASASGVPRILALFGPTDPLQWAPITPRLRWLQSDTGSMDSLSVESVMDAIQTRFHE